jgi:hypothetical protein
MTALADISVFVIEAKGAWMKLTPSCPRPKLLEGAMTEGDPIAALLARAGWKLIEGGPRKCGPDEYEVVPSILGLVRWQRDQAAQQRPAIRRGMREGVIDGGRE